MTNTHADPLKFKNYCPRERTRILNGFCRHCGEPRGPNGTQTRCAECRLRNNAGHRARYQRNIQAGNCGWCGQPREDQNRAHCKSCIKGLNEYTQERVKQCIEQDLCQQCLKPLDRDGVRCTACNDWRNACWRAKRAANPQKRGRKPKNNQQEQEVAQ